MEAEKRRMFKVSAGLDPNQNHSYTLSMCISSLLIVGAERKADNTSLSSNGFVSSLSWTFKGGSVQKVFLEHKLHELHKLTQKYFSKNYLADN